MNEPKIEKGVPFSSKRGGAFSLSDFLNAMEIGDSFEIRSSERSGWGYSMREQKKDGKLFIGRKQANNMIRIWRTK